MDLVNELILIRKGKSKRNNHIINVCCDCTNFISRGEREKSDREMKEKVEKQQINNRIQKAESMKNNNESVKMPQYAHTIHTYIHTAHYRPFNRCGKGTG